MYHLGGDAACRVGTDVVSATYSGDSNHTGGTGSVNQVIQGGIATSINVTSVSPAAEDYGADTPVTITAALTWVGNGVAPTASDVTISGNGHGTYGATSCAPRVHESITCTATYTPNHRGYAVFLHGDRNVLGRHQLQWIEQPANQQLHHQRVVLNHGRYFQPESVGLRDVRDVHGDDHQQHRERQGRSEEERRETAECRRDGDLEREYRLRPST